MSLFRSIKIALVAIPLALTSALADAVDVEAVASGGYWTRDEQLRDVGDLLLFGKMSFVDIGMNYAPLPTQIPLKSKFGEHNGFAVRHHFSLMASHPISQNNYLSALLLFERSGWDGEDFLFFPKYTDFGLIRSVTTWGLGYTNTAIDYSIAAGMQHQNVEFVGDVFPAENDSLLYTWANLRFGRISAQTEFHRTHFRMLRLSVDLEDRELFGGASSGLWTYMPNIDATIYKRELEGFDEDFVRVNWEQNLFAQMLYAEVSFDFPDDGFHSAALKLYPEPSRLFSVEFTCLRRRAVADNWDDLMFGWAFEMPLLRVGYNSAYEYDHLFHAKGTWFVELQFNMGSFGDALFAKNGRKSTPLQTREIKRKNTPDKKSEIIPLDSQNSQDANAPKTITAKGIRYEKSGSEGGK